MPNACTKLTKTYVFWIFIIVDAGLFASVFAMIILDPSLFWQEVFWAILSGATILLGMIGIMLSCYLRNPEAHGG